MRIGVLGGTFDPPHVGHLMLAEEAHRKLCLDRVVFVTAGRPWVKASMPVSPAAVRQEMVSLAIAGKNCYSIDELEVRRPGPSYTWQTLEDLRRKYPADELYFILGWDTLNSLPSWQEPQRIIAAACLAAAPRIGCPPPDLCALDLQVPGLAARTVVMTEPEIDISATAIRERVKLGLPIDHLVTAPVADYIARRGLYKE